ncbi:MAG: hypothetical protein BGO41_02390 [Clostridiales bacterium 38-18]|nr:MAG: hypothetical protein BGO41_02390 [Clostridiales bacterium 38-18]
MSIYLDHASTTPLSNEVKKIILESLEHYGNPSSLHGLGLASERKIKQVKKRLSEIINGNENNIIFTSGGTEANNLAILGMARKRKTGKIITSVIEHPSVLASVEQLGKEGYEIRILEVNDKGIINLEQLASELTTDTLLVSIMMINNEIGSVQPIKAISEIIRNFNDQNGVKIKFHVDAVQAFGKIQIDVKQLGIDALSISSHKINGLKGCGALYLASQNQIKPLVYGGQQEFSIRPGTENLLGIIAFGEAMQNAQANLMENYTYVSELKNRFIEIIAADENIIINSPNDFPYILNISVLGVKGEVLLHSLEMKSVYVSTGAACSSKKKNQSHVLEALKLNENSLESAIRVSFGKENRIEDIETAAKWLLEISSSLRTIMKMKKR